VRADGVYERQFSNGLVLVNPTPHARHVDLGGVYTGSGVVNSRATVIAPHSGLVLMPSLLTSLLHVVHLVEANLSPASR
jgi:hypothetical protein